MATLTTVHNPFDPINSREIKEVQVGKPIYSVIDGFYCHFDVVVSLNGQITHDYEYVIQEEDHIGFVAVPSKGGGKNPFAMIAMIALTIAAPYAVGAMMGVSGTALGMSAGMAIGGLSGAMIVGANIGVMMLGGMLINSLMAPDMPSTTPTTSIASSPTYGWDNVQNQSAEGIALPIVYGKTKIVPPIISQYVETKDNKQYLNILYALNNGEITSVSDITINNNPITYFNDVTYEVRNGTNSQTLIPSFDNTRVDQSVGAKLSITETIRRTSYNNVRGLTIIVSAPSGMYYANDKGGLDSRSVTLVVKYKKVGDATWTTIANTSISGATTSTIRQTFQADDIPAGEYDISITRTTAESTSTRTSDKVYFEGFTEIIYNDFTYPNTALLAIRALATDQLSGSMPSVSCVVDRGFGTSNPATAARNILELVGADVIDSAFEEWATWCTSQNFTCNMVFDSEVNVRDALNIVGMLGRANVIQIGSEYMPIIDRVEDMPVQRFLFTMGNIIRDSFKEEYLPLADRSNVVEVTYFDSTLEYEKQSVEIFQYGFDESSDTVRKASVTLYGCTNRTQAVRHGRFLMNKNRYLTNTVSFEADVDAIACTIGDVINVSHDVPQWGYSGRVIDATVTNPLSWAYTQSTYTNGTLSDDTNTKLIQLDREVTLNASTVYQLVIRQHDDTIVTVAISTDTYTATDVLPVPLSVTIGDYDVFAFGETSRVTKLFRVISITRSSDQRRKISAIEYITEVYNDSLDNLALPTISDLGTTSYLQVVMDTEVASDGRSINIINLMWNGQAIAWDVFMQDALATTWTLIGNTQHHFYQIKDVPAGYYNFKVGNHTASATLVIAAQPLADVDNFISFYQNNQLVLRWDEVVEQYRSPILYEIRRGTSWSNSEILGKSITNSYIVDAAGAYWVKAYYKDLNGVETYSVNATGLVVSSANILRNVVATWDEYDTDWSGTLSGVVIDGVNLKLPIGTTYGTYDIPSGHIVTLSTAQLCRVSMSYSGAGGDVSSNFDLIPDVDLVEFIDGDVTGQWSIKPKLAISQDGTTFGAWQDFVIGDYVGMAFKARLEITSLNEDFIVICDGFTFTVDMPDRVEKRDGLALASGGTTITHSFPFQAKPSTVITIVNAVAGDEIFLTAEDQNGFTAQIKNGGVGVARTINSISQGY